MKPTGIIRRIDDLGRVLVPKGVRTKLKIEEGDPLEIFIDGDFVMLKKYTSEDDKTITENPPCTHWKI